MQIMHHHFDDGNEVQETRKRRVELVEPRADAPTALESPEQPFDLIPQLAGFPFGFPVRLRRRDRRHPHLVDKAAGLVASAGAVHRRRRVRDRLVPALQQGAAFGRVVGLAVGQAKITACRSLAETMWIFVFQPPRDLPMHCGPFSFRAAVEAEAVRVPADRFLFPKRGEQPLEHAAAGPAAEPGVNRGPVVEPLPQRAPLAVVLQDVRKRVDEDYIRNPHVLALKREKRAGYHALF